MFAFIIFFINCVHNLFVAIIQEGFNSLTERPVKNIGESDSESEQELESSFQSQGSLKLKKSEIEMKVEEDSN